MKKLVLILFIFTGSGEILNLTKFALKNLDDFVDDDSKRIGSGDCEPEEEGSDEGLLGLIRFARDNYLNGCVNVILYDSRFEKESSKLNFNLKDLLRNYPGDYVNGQVSDDVKINEAFLRPQANKCTHYLLFVPDLNWTTRLIGRQTVSKVIVVTLSTRWKIEEYLRKSDSAKIVNLLIVSHVTKQDIFFGLEERSSLSEYTNLYTHNLLVDPVGSSAVEFLTSWRCGKLTRNVNLFPVKMNKGFNGKQFLISASEQPPFTFKKRLSLDEDSNDSQLWDGVEIRLLRLLSDFLNYTIEIKKPKISTSKTKGPSEIVIEDVVAGTAEIGSAGVYVSNQRLMEIWLSVQHTTDCAAFITKASTSLPRYRAILGPFQLSVWIALTVTYLIAIIPLTFADSHSLKSLIDNPWLIEDMFWHVFGTFTNLFTFTEKKSWTKTKKNASRLLIGWYWAFSIIITACYTGSIVSFITLFVFPEVIDHVDQLVKMNFRIGTISTTGWNNWFNNSGHEKTKWLLRDVELVPDASLGLKNVSKSHYLPMFRPYAFLAGRAQMEYLVQANYSTSNQKAMLHITKDCFVPFGVSFVFPKNAIYADKFNEYILRSQQSGLMGKLLNEFKWEVERSSSGKLLQAGSGKPLREVVPLQRKLRLDDTQGIYLLLGSGYLIATLVFFGELLHSRREKKKSKGGPLFGSHPENGVESVTSSVDPEKDGRLGYDHDGRNQVHRRKSSRSRNFPARDVGDESFDDFKSTDEYVRKNVFLGSVASLPWKRGSESFRGRINDLDRSHTS